MKKYKKVNNTLFTLSMKVMIEDNLTMIIRYITITMRYNSITTVVRM